MGEIKREEDEPYDSSFEEDDAMSFVNAFNSKMEYEKANGIGIWANSVTESDCCLADSTNLCATFKLTI